MMSLEAFIDVIRARVRSFAYKIAKKLNVIFGGRISPNAITLIGLVMHVPIAWLIAQGNLTVAAILLVIFGSFDALDGALARLQKNLVIVVCYSMPAPTELKKLFCIAVWQYSLQILAMQRWQSGQ